VDTIKRESRKDRVNPARKYIRLQEIGLAFFLSWPVAMMLAAMYHFEAIIGQITVLIIVAAVIFFAFGHVGRQELTEREKGE
jgi:hypothetical protein